ncbi:MAG: hypothetical protein ACXWZ6_10800 [Solirubrobacterales bacterium]
MTIRCREAPPDRTTWRGIPVTSLPRTIVDLAAVLPEAGLARAFHEAAVRHRTTPAQVSVCSAGVTTGPAPGGSAAFSGATCRSP